MRDAGSVLSTKQTSQVLIIVITLITIYMRKLRHRKVISLPKVTHERDAKLGFQARH